MVIREILNPIFYILGSSEDDYDCILFLMIPNKSHNVCEVIIDISSLLDCCQIGT